MKPVVVSLLFLLALLSLSMFVFDPTHLYYELPWLDIPMHILGGFGVSAFFLALASYKNAKPNLVRLCILYACVAVGWEVYELANDIVMNSPWNGWSDTVSDVINGAFGAFIGFYFLKK